MKGFAEIERILGSCGDGLRLEAAGNDFVGSSDDGCVIDIGGVAPPKSEDDAGRFWTFIVWLFPRRFEAGKLLKLSLSVHEH